MVLTPNLRPVTLLMLMASDAIAVPLAPAFPAEEMRYQINQSGALALLYSDKFAKIGAAVLQQGLDNNPTGVKLDKLMPRETQPAEQIKFLSSSEEALGGMMLYTSGTTAKPKGVLLPQSALEAQSKSLAEAWNYSPKDRLLHVLPLHHIHGTVNALLTPLLAGSTIEFMFPFNVDKVWSRLSTPFLPSSPEQQQHQQQPITFFTVVPTIWSRMLQTADKLPEESRKAAFEAIQRKHLRLNISGSAALPTPTKAAWTELSQGNILLERYGMTEVGMALSCGLSDSDRVDGSVGWPLPSVQARLVNTDTGDIIPETSLGEEHAGEIQLHGPTIFKEYFQNPEATKKEFTEDGWFKTGDIAFRQNVDGAGSGASGAWATGPAWFIQGRKSADIIKTGGEKISALEIERQLLSLPEVSECAVVGLPSEAWGQKAAAIVVLTEQGKTAGKGGKQWSALDMRRALKERLAAYKIPQDMEVVQELPRNAMGKINKKDLISKVFGDPTNIRRRSIEVKEQREAAKNQSGAQS
jgi:acyl-CoA synthetase (AMP-forming)/AMP-acid ligase II